MGLSRRPGPTFGRSRTVRPTTNGNLDRVLPCQHRSRSVPPLNDDDAACPPPGQSCCPSSTECRRRVPPLRYVSWADRSSPSACLPSPLQTLRAWPLPSPAACSPSRRYYASARSSRVPPTAFDPIGFDDDEPSLKPTPPKDVKAEKRAWRAAAAAEKEVLAQARLERLTEEVERGRRRKVGDWEAHEREQARAREEQLKSLAASEREDKRRRTVEKVLVRPAAVCCSSPDERPSRADRGIVGCCAASSCRQRRRPRRSERPTCVLALLPPSTSCARSLTRRRILAASCPRAGPYAAGGADAARSVRALRAFARSLASLHLVAAQAILTSTPPPA